MDKGVRIILNPQISAFNSTNIGGKRNDE